MKQRYNTGDHIMIAKNLGEGMSHFTNDAEAIVKYTYSQKFGGDNIDSYCLFIKDHGETSWYHEHQLTLIEENRSDLLEIWEKEKEDEIKLKSDIDWIFDNGPVVADSPHGASVSTLASCFGLTNLWGSNGEGITYYTNSMGTLQIAKPFLLKKDKKGWLERCKEIKKRLTLNNGK